MKDEKGVDAIFATDKENSPTFRLRRRIMLLRRI